MVYVHGLVPAGMMMSPQERLAHVSPHILMRDTITVSVVAPVSVDPVPRVSLAIRE